MDDRFEWDEAKRLATLEKHGIDFRRAIEVFSGDPVVVKSVRNDEDRWMAVGMVDGIEIAVIYTIRGDRVRIVTVRRARHGERRAYHARHA